MKNIYSKSCPQTMCIAVYKHLQMLKFTGLSHLIVDISNLSTISSSEYYAVTYNIPKCLAMLSTNPLCLLKLLVCLCYFR